ncbi:MAG: hypothetical protein ACFFD4_02630 [Candidatus Odinarchaeota archaeon]
MQLDVLSEEELKQLVEMFQREQMGMGTRRNNFTDEARKKLETLGFIEHDKGVYYLTVAAERTVKKYLKEKEQRMSG